MPDVWAFQRFLSGAWVFRHSLPDVSPVGFTISEYNLAMALIAAFVVAVVTFAISFTGLVIGKKAGGKFTDRAEIFGGIILIGIGMEIFLKGLFF